MYCVVHTSTSFLLIPTFLFPFLDFRLFSFPLHGIFLFLGILQLSSLSWLFRPLLRLVLIIGDFLLYLFHRFPSTSWLHLFTQ